MTACTSRPTATLDARHVMGVISGSDEMVGLASKHPSAERRADWLREL
jgi:hypothetical protein